MIVPGPKTPSQRDPGRIFRATAAPVAYARYRSVKRSRSVVQHGVFGPEAGGERWRSVRDLCSAGRREGLAISGKQRELGGVDAGAKVCD
ncbi:hypothetical protein V501_05391 [Pseudogymnoascus sp. VKM F-4519 (FW-2642)]|nr:hypothetical protein V501_05391 [Pseudogymnoascus sp. VKM F-4519 (FW-2642)]